MNSPVAPPVLSLSRDGETEQPLRDCVQAALKSYFRDLQGHAPGNLYQMVLQEVEQPMLEAVMRYADGNQSRAAAILGMNRGTLRKKLNAYGIE